MCVACVVCRVLREGCCLLLLFLLGLPDVLLVGMCCLLYDVVCCCVLFPVC